MKNFCIVFTLCVMFFLASCGGNSNETVYNDTDSGSQSGEKNGSDNADSATDTTPDNGDSQHEGTESSDSVDDSGDTAPDNGDTSEPTDDADSSDPVSDDDSDSTGFSIGNICTGQTTCYNEAKQITCPASSTVDFYGQDSQYDQYDIQYDRQYIIKQTCFPQSFSSSWNSEVLTDNNTGLTWETSPSTKIYTWYDAQNHCADLNSSNYGGKSNWRLPNPMELLTIVDHSTDSINSSISLGDISYLWTSKEYSGNTSLAHFYYTYNSTLHSTGSKTLQHNVLCVSGNELVAATSGDFITSFDGKVVTDNRTGLMWQQKKYVGKTWQEALKYCEDSIYAGYSDWRLPNINELASLWDPGKSGSPYSNFPDMPGNRFWSSSTDTHSLKYAWGIDFDSSYVSFWNKTDNRPNTVFVRCVREGVCKEGYFWDGSTCVNPCNDNPCNNIANSNKNCTPKNAFEYSCGCNDRYLWNGSTCEISLGNICTGQNRCYNNTKEISCPTSETADFYGQDAWYASLGKCTPQSFSSSSNVVIDNNTGLTWEKSPSTEFYTWYDAQNHCADLNSSNYGGKSNWRLPNPLELLTIIDLGQPNPATNSNFTNMPTGSSDLLWTNKEYDEFKAFTFNPYYGENVSGESTTSTHKVLCVSGNELIGTTWDKFTTQTISGKVVVTDSKTGLMWQKKYTTDKTWQEALKYCEDSIYAGYSDWRLPNINELLSLINYERPEKPYSSFPDMPNISFWSSSVSDRTALAISFYFGTLFRRVENTMAIRCVRRGLSCEEGYFWEGSACVTPCDNNPCNNVANSNKICTPENAFDYSCGCNDGYFWNGSACVTPCDDNPCSNVANSNKICTPENAFDYSCGCNNGYSWNGSACVISHSTICTGQNKCYNNSDTITCQTSSSDDFFGQDAQYAELGTCVPQRFRVESISDKNVVVDINTGLMWQQTTTGPFSYSSTSSYCNNLTYAGYSDWRLPTPQELLTIVDNSTSAPAIDTEYFPDTPSEWVRSSSTNCDFQDNVWSVHFGSGKVSCIGNPNKYYFRCVRYNYP